MTIGFEDLHVRLGNSPALRGLRGRIEQGCVTAIIGPNGAGKTTLLRALLGLIPVHAGSILIDGRPLVTLSMAERARRLAYLPQSGAPHWNVTARELVSFGRLPWRGRLSAPGADDAAAVEAALAATDTAHLADRTVDTLSGGERARVMFARVLAQTSDWIFADEPLANLDPPHQRDVLSRLKSAAHDGGKGVVVVLHELSAAASVADDVLILRDGELIATEMTAQTLEAAFDMPFEMITHEGRSIVLPKED